MNRDELASGNWEKTVEATGCICEVHGEVRKTAGCSSALRAGALTANLTDARKVAWRTLSAPVDPHQRPVAHAGATGRVLSKLGRYDRIASSLRPAFVELVVVVSSGACLSLFTSG